MTNPQDHLNSLLGQLAELPHRDDDALDALMRRSEMVIRRIFGETTKYLNDLSRINFHPMVYPADDSYYESTWAGGVSSLRNLFHTILEEVELFDIKSTDEPEIPADSKSAAEAKIFIVHGHDEATKAKVARFIEHLGLTAIILHERVDSGRTIIEKFEQESSSVKFAVVLLTADDVGAAKSSKDETQFRARQNVIFELGYFVGALGRSNVVALRESGVEMPSDYAGIVYVDLDRSDAWHLHLAREIKAAGINIDMNKAL